MKRKCYAQRKHQIMPVLHQHSFKQASLFSGSFLVSSIALQQAVAGSCTK